MVNLNDIKDEAFIIPPGRYKVVISNCIEKASKKGAQQWELDATVCEPAEVGGVKTLGFKLRDWITFTGSMWKEKIAGLGLPTTGDIYPINVESKIGYVTVINELYKEKGRMTSKIKDYDGFTAAPGKETVTQAAPVNKTDKVPF